MGIWDTSEVSSGAQKLDTLSRQDSEDPLATLQAGYLWAHLATLNIDTTQNRAAVNNAIERLERGIQLDPYFGLHYLNLSVLYMKAGRTIDAQNTDKRAVELSFGDPAAWLNEGILFEAAGNTENAKTDYLKALTLLPSWKRAGFWQTSNIRRETLASYQPTIDEKYADLIANGDAARRADQKSEAMKDYEEALATTQDSFQTSIANGLIALTHDDTATAQTEFRRAAAIAGDTPASIDPWAYLGDLASSQGDRDATINAYNHVYRFLTSRGSEGLDTARFVAYSLNSFWHSAPVLDYVPDVVMLDISTEHAQRLDVLAKLVSVDQSDFAIQIYRAVLQANPQDTTAAAGLQQLTASVP